MVSRTSEQSMTKFYRQLRGDIMAGKRGKYLQYIRVSASFVTACKCERSAHIYCITAKVLRTRKIYCERCLCHYNLYIRQENICSNRLLGRLTSWILLVLLLVFVTGALLVLDGFLKFNHAKQHPE